MSNSFNLGDFHLTGDQRAIALTFLKLFKIQHPVTGLPVTVDTVATEGQITIFYLLVWRPQYRVHIMASTQYGKSLFVALACIIITCIQKEVVSVVAPTNDKAKIIMRYYVEHLGDQPMFEECLEKSSKLERLRLEETKERVMLNNGGGIYVISAQANNSSKTIEAAMGLGSKIAIVDEACLLPDATEATLFRMIAGKGPYAFYCKIGNPFYRVAPYTHFYTSWNDPGYVHVNIDYIQGLAEGRYTRSFIEEARKKPLFSVLFENAFPPADQQVDGGWSPLLTEDEVRAAFVKGEPGFGNKRMGVDVAGGGRNFSTMVLRYSNVAKKVYKSHEADTMIFAGNVLRYADNYRVADRDVFIDGVGIGRGASDRVREQRKGIRMIEGGDKPNDETRFTNLRTEMYWKAREYVLNGGKLEEDEDWLQLSQMRWKVVDSSGKIKLMSKEELSKNGVESPDVADALSMTFARPDERVEEQEEYRYYPQAETTFDPY